MIRSLLIRLLNTMIMSVICSLPIYLGYVVKFRDNAILLISFALFAIAISIDAFRFSFNFNDKKDYCFGQLLPLIIYAVIGVITCLVFPPIVFNRIFLPLRLAGIFDIFTINSIVITTVLIIAIVTVARLFGIRASIVDFIKYDNDQK